MEHPKTTAIALSDTKAAAIYFDYVLSPYRIQRLVDSDEFGSDGLNVEQFVSIGQERLKDLTPPGWNKQAFLDAATQFIRSRHKERQDILDTKNNWKRRIADSTLTSFSEPIPYPPSLREIKEKARKNIDAMNSEHEIIESIVKGEIEIRPMPTDNEIFVHAINQMQVPVTAIYGESKDDLLRSEVSDPAVMLAGLRLIDAKRVPWAQIMELRKDRESVSALRRLRLFWRNNYDGMSKSHVQEDLLSRIEEYEKRANAWDWTLHCPLFPLCFLTKTQQPSLE